MNQKKEKWRKELRFGIRVDVMRLRKYLRPWKKTIKKHPVPNIPGDEITGKSGVTRWIKT